MRPRFRRTTATWRHGSGLTTWLSRCRCQRPRLSIYRAKPRPPSIYTAVEKSPRMAMGGGVFWAGATPYDPRDTPTALLHLLGFDQHDLTYPHLGRDERLTLVEGKIIREIV